jgi:hypothetical protein
MAAVLMQKHNNHLHPLAYISKTLNSAQRNYSTTKKEALALVFALEHFRHIIYMFPIHVYTDHQPLLGALQKPTKDQCLQRWSLLIQEYDIKLHYIEGKENVCADALSRMPDPTIADDVDAQFLRDLNARNEHVHTLQDYIPEKVPWSAIELRNAQRKDQNCMKIINQIQANRDTAKLGTGQNKVPDKILIDSRIINGTLYIVREINRGTYSDQFLVPYVPDALMEAAFKLLHTDVTAGHKDPDRTLKV